MMSIYTYPTIYFVIIIFGLFNYKKYRNNLFLNLFLYFLVYSFLTEVIGTYFGRVLLIKNNFIYNTWNIVNHLFYAFFFLSRVTTKNKRKLITGLIIFYILFSIINISFFKNYLNQVLINNIIIGSLLIVFVIMVYYTELLNSDAILSIKKSLFFWISIGVLLSNIILIPVWVFAEFFSYEGIYTYIILASNIIMSLCFITGFLISKKSHNN